MIIRALDDLGRVVIPKEMRRILAINAGDEIAISLVDGKVVFEKYTSVCFICNSEHDVQLHNKAHLCGDCRDRLAPPMVYSFPIKTVTQRIVKTIKITQYFLELALQPSPEVFYQI